MTSPYDENYLRDDIEALERLSAEIASIATAQRELNDPRTVSVVPATVSMLHVDDHPGVRDPRLHDRDPVRGLSVR